MRDKKLTEIAQNEPIVEIELANRKLTLLGTAHVSKASADHVKRLLKTGDYDAVALELCPNRYKAMRNPDSLSDLDLLKVIREGKASMVIANLALGAYQQRIAEEMGIKPGAEMHAAMEVADQQNIPIVLIDRDVGTTLKRIYRNVSWWRRLYLLSGLFASMFSSEKIDAQEIEKLKKGDLLENIFTSFATEAQDLYKPLIGERDEYMAAKLIDESKNKNYKSLLAVVGAGHLKGVEKYLKDDSPPDQRNIDSLEHIPPASRWPKVIPWIIVSIILAGFAYGFYTGSEMGWNLIWTWVLINGGLCALGALIALAHPLTFISAFVAAPITSLNPTIGAGMVTAAVELFMRKPKVGDFSNLRSDTKHPSGWWKNRVSRVLLVFFFTTLGSVFGTYIAGFKIVTALFGNGELS